MRVIQADQHRRDQDALVAKAHALARIQHARNERAWVTLAKRSIKSGAYDVAINQLAMAREEGRAQCRVIG
jgi:hypothetical protein